MQVQLRPGTVLDGRYRIDAMMGQGGFGITYAAENTRVGMKVAVKELFWRGHSVRRDEASPEVALADGTDSEVFESQKRRFLQEARTIRDFSGQPGVVRILDYFEANGTAYIVMEFVEGETLAARAAAGPMPCEDLLRRFLPLIDSLDAIHRAGVIHRDVSPDNIMVQPDGSLKLIDFGAARQFRGEDGRYTAISRDSYSPGEQYDKNGRQGPWTDVYSLCATLYACVCGAPPPGAVQRMFLDELQAPSALGVDIDPAHEAILMKGLQLRPEKRWQGMGELAAAIRGALPEEKPQKASRRGLLLGLLAGLLCAALAAGIWGWRRYDAAHKFRGVETERIRFMATEDTTAAEFAAAQEELRKRLENFAGKDNYIARFEADAVEVTLPLSLFEGREISGVLGEHFAQLVPGKGINYRYERKADWEDPAQSALAGRNQVLPDAVPNPSVVEAYRWDVSLTEGQRVNLLQDVKTRLDALDTPYAFGTAYGNPNTLMFRISLERSGFFLENTLCREFPLRVCDACSLHSSTVYRTSSVLEPQKEKDGAASLRYALDFDSDRQQLEAYTRILLEAGVDTLYLQDYNDNAIARVPITEPVTDGALVFRDFCLEGIPEIDDEHLWVLNYLDALMNQTSLPASCTGDGGNYYDADGQLHLEDCDYEYGLRYVDPPDNAEVLRGRLDALQQEYGFTYDENRIHFWLFFHLEVNDRLADEVTTRLPGLLESLLADQGFLPKRLILCFVDEDNGLGLRLTLYSSYYLNEDHISTHFTSAYQGDAVEPSYNALREWSAAFDWASLGLEPLTF